MDMEFAIVVIAPLTTLFLAYMAFTLIGRWLAIQEKVVENRTQEARIALEKGEEAGLRAWAKTRVAETQNRPAQIETPLTTEVEPDDEMRGLAMTISMSNDYYEPPVSETN